MDDVVSVIDAIGRLVAAIWLPVVLVFVLVRYRVPLGQFFEDIGEFSINAFGVQATVKRKAGGYGGAPGGGHRQGDEG